MEMWEINGADFENGKVIAIYVSHDYLDLDNTKFVPARPHGEWKQVGEMTYKCTKCGWIKKTGLMPYCENCGSDNRGK